MDIVLICYVIVTFFANIHYDIQSLPRKQNCAVDYPVIVWHLLVDTQAWDTGLN